MKGHTSAYKLSHPPPMEVRLTNQCNSPTLNITQRNGCLFSLPRQIAHSPTSQMHKQEIMNEMKHTDHDL